MKKRYTDEELLELARGHKQYITSTGAWEKYRKDSKQQLPHSQTFVSRFGSWNGFKEKLSLAVNEQNRPVKYTDEYLYDTLTRYGKQYTSVNDWNRFAEANDLPSHRVFILRLGEDVLYEKVGFVSEWTTEKLKKLIRNHFPDAPPTRRAWDSLQLSTMKPSYQTIVRRFGSWQQMKYYVYYAR